MPVQETPLFAGTEPKPRRRIATLEELFRQHPEFKEVLKGATEQEVPKPKGKAKRQGHYSGKRKRHTLKTQVTTSRDGLLLHVSRSVAGRVNDLTLLRGSGVLRELPAELPVRLDRGYDGLPTATPRDASRRLIKPGVTTRSTLSRSGLISFTTATACRSKTPWRTSNASSS